MFFVFRDPSCPGSFSTEAKKWGKAGRWSTIGCEWWNRQNEVYNGWALSPAVDKNSGTSWEGSSDVEV